MELKGENIVGLMMIELSVSVFRVEYKPERQHHERYSLCSAEILRKLLGLSC